MSRLGDVQQIIIIDNNESGNYTKLIDNFKPRDAQRCFICVDKFHGSYKYGTLIQIRANAFHNISLSINGVQNSYSNDPASKTIVRSNIVDSWMTNLFSEQTSGYYATYLYESNQPTWLEIAMSDLNNFQLKFQASSASSNFIDDISFSPISLLADFQFYLRLKLRFE